MRQTIERHGLIEQGDRVLVALSGGPDSVALLHVLTVLRDEYALGLGAVYINHGIRPRAAKKEERFCGALCERLGVDLYLNRADIPSLARKRRMGLEETAREYRYGIFEEIAAEYRFNRVALGHQADDQAETVLFRVLRGTGHRGLAGIPIKRGMFVRPLLETTREEILGYLKQHKLSFCEDSTNRDRRFRRNYLRYRLIPLLEREVNPSVRRALVDLADNVADEEEYLADVAAEVRRRVVSQTAGGKFELDLSKLLRYDRWIRRRLLRYCISASSADGSAPDKETLDRLEEAVEKLHPGMSLPGRVRAVRVDDTLVIYRPERHTYRMELPLGGSTGLRWPRLDFSARLGGRRAGPVRQQRRARRVQMDPERVVLPLVVRSIEPGDRFRPLGMKGSKKVGDYLTDRKVPSVYRDEIPVVCDGEGIVWLVGYELSDRVKIDPATRKVLTVECSERPPDEAEAV